MKHTHTQNLQSIRLPETVLLGIIITVLVGALSIAGYAFLERIGYELHAPFTADSPIYWAVGRGILNGLTPYVDLFETKPPGIFVLSALSFFLTDDVQLLGVFQSISLLLIPFFVALPFCFKKRTHNRLKESAELLLGIIFGILLSLYIAERSGEFQVESFGAMFTCAYFAILQSQNVLSKKIRMAFLSAALFGAIGMKEPFLLTALGLSILHAKSIKEWMNDFLLPLIIAGLVGTLLMAFLGYLEPYLYIYLPEMLGKHIHTSEPLLKRSMNISILWNDIRNFSAAFAYVVTVLMALMVAHFIQRRNLIQSSALFSIKMGLLLLLLGASVGIGGTYWNHHFVFAAPAMAAFFFYAMQHIHYDGMFARMNISLVILSSVLSFGALNLPSAPYTARIEGAQHAKSFSVDIAADIDTILDNCNIDRYLFLGGNGNQPYGFTKHSPLGPLFLQYPYWLSEDRITFRESMLQNIHEASLIVFERLDMGPFNTDIQTIIEKEFTPGVPSCGKISWNTGAYTILHKRDRSW